jgi:DNA-binding GntR family transcriptional regulator
LSRKKLAVARDGRTPTLFSELQHFSLPRAITEKVHMAILTGELKPGQRITELQIARAMGVSRVSVREAFQRLRAVGVLTSSRRKTYVSGSPGQEEIRDLYRIRGVCEGLAAQAAKKNLRKGDLFQLETLVLQMEQASRGRDIETFGKADLAFHNRIWQANDKPYLQKILGAITSPYHPFLVALLRKSGPRALLGMTRWHRKALEDIKRFSGDELCKQTELHYKKVGDEFVALMRYRNTKRYSTSRGEARRA